MLEKILDAFESITATVISGVALAASLSLSFLNIELEPAWIAVIISGIPILSSAIKKLLNKKGIEKISSALLISIAMVSSVIIGDVFAAGEVAFIMAIGEILEDKTTDRAKKGLKKLISLVPNKARLLNNGNETIIDAKEIKVGDIIRIFPGETIAVDGEILNGNTSIDQSVITGESLPIDKTVGDSVFCGTINRFGSVDIKATKVGSDSTLQKLISMVKEAENKKAPMQRIADKWASILVPVALLLAILGGVLTNDIIVAVTVLVVFCPCALVLATPTAIMAAIGQATKHGVIIKSGEALEKMGRVNTIAFDKTGTLTLGTLSVSDVISFSELTENELLTIAASAESKSEHPLGKAIVENARSKDLILLESQDFIMEAGKGVSAKVNGKTVLCGNEKFVLNDSISLSSDISEKTETLSAQGKALVFVSIDNEIAGIISLSDTLKETAPDTIKALTDCGVKSVLLTGDNNKTAEYFATKVGITEIKSELLPENKVEHIKALQENGHKVCMIGDGINDAPALKTADVGVAMGTIGSDISVDAADIALMQDDISKLPYLKKLSKATVKTIKFSISLSLIINFVAIILSFLKLLTPTTGALVHNAGSVFVVLIAALLYDRRFDK